MNMLGRIGKILQALTDLHSAPCTLLALVGPAILYKYKAFTH